MKPINLLIVDDEPDIRDVFALTFELDGHKIYTAANGLEAVNIVKNHKIDFIISDVCMPGTDGIFLLDELKKNCPNIPVIVLVSGLTNISREDALKKGAVELLNKPPNLDELIGLIEKYSC